MNLKPSARLGVFLDDWFLISQRGMPMKRIFWILALVVVSMLSVMPSAAQGSTQEHASYQPFEHGFMLYLRESGSVFVFVDHGNGKRKFLPLLYECSRFDAQ